MPMPQALRKAPNLLAGLATVDAASAPSSVLLESSSVAPPAPPAPPASPTPPAPPAPPEIQIAAQERELWCWAAVIATLLAAQGRTVSQCRIAETHLIARRALARGESCCGTSPAAAGAGAGATVRCNRTALLDQALIDNGFPPPRVQNCGGTTWSELETALKSGAVPCQVISGAFRHFCLIGPRTTRLTGGGFWIDFHDPWLATRASFPVDTLCFVPEGGYLVIVDQLFFL